jgi:hypothetical protein
MRLLPNVIGVFLVIVGCAWALAGFGYIRETAMSGSHLSGFSDSSRLSPAW